MEKLYGYRYKYSGKIITQVSMHELAKVLEKCRQAKWSKGKFGLGCIQWTGERTYTLFKLYQQECNYADKITIEQAIAAEGKMVINELKSASFNFIYDDWKKYNGNKNSGPTAYIAAQDICKIYEKPADAAKKALTRGNTAQDIYIIMTG